MPILKIFADKKQVAAVLKRGHIIESYEAFVVAEAGSAQAAALSEQFPLEDITDEYRVNIAGKSVDPLQVRSASKAGLKKAAPDAKPHHYIVQFIGPVKKTWTGAIARAGAKLKQPYGGFAYVVRANAATVTKLRALPHVRWVGHVPHEARIASALRDGAGNKAQKVAPRRRVLPDVLTVQVFATEDVAPVARAAKRLGYKVLSQEPANQVLVVETENKSSARARQVRELSAAHGVRYIRERAVRRTSNNVATGLMGNKWAAVVANGPELSGQGEVIAVCDTGLDSGDPRHIHPDFAGRVQAIKSYPIAPDWASYVNNPGANDGPSDVDSGHGTHVAGSVLGDGSASASLAAPIRGHAHKAKLVFQAIEQQLDWKPNAPGYLRSERYQLAGIPANLEALFKYAYDQGARIHSNSWGGGDPGSYDDMCSQFDKFVWKNKDFCFVVAAGNDGSDADGDGSVNLGSVSSPGTAKNCITVGASENERANFKTERYGDWWPNDYPVEPLRNDPMADSEDQVAAFSSRGPTKDGRVKPDIVAPGTFILSARSSQIAANNQGWAAFPANRQYFHMGGTSMATPLTAGAVALIREFLRKKRSIASPSAALLKAVLIAGARRSRVTGGFKQLFDHDQGFGHVDLTRSLRTVRATVEGIGLSTGEQATGKFTVTRASRTLRVVLAYSDYPGPTLINNLNLIISDPGGKQFVGNQPVGSKSLSTDGRNNVEVIEIAKAKKGTYTFRVIASNVSVGPQDFALAAVTI